MILHVDMDAFYASVEIRDRPELADRPVVVGGTPQGRGVVCAANYIAREFGIHSAQPAATAVRLCPHATFLAPRMEYYAQISQQIRKIFDQFTPLVEPLSLDEAFLDVTGSEAIWGSSIEIGHRIKTSIRDELSLVASVGVAPNKFLAKIASDLEKPDGFVVVDANKIQQFLDPLPVRRIWGVGPTTGKALARLGIHSVGDLRRLDARVLADQFGEHGEHLWRLAQGIDNRRVVPQREAKSISHETTFGRDIDDVEVQRAWVVELAEQVGCRLRRKQMKGRTVQLKVRYNDFRTLMRAKTLPNATDVTAEIAAAAVESLETLAAKKHGPVRLLGVGVTGFDHHETRQLLLFDEDQHKSHQRIDTAADEIRKRFGAASLTRGSRLLHKAKHRPQPRPGEDA